MVHFVALIKTFLFYFILPLLVPFILIFFAWRIIAAKFLIKFIANSGKILTCRSSLAGTDGIYTFPKYSLVVVSVFEGSVSLDRIRSTVNSRVINAHDQNGNVLRPEFQQFVEPHFGFLFWVNEENFQVQRHIRMYDGNLKPKFRGQEVTPEILILMASELAYKPFPPGTSPWELLLVPNYREFPGSHLCTAMILHVHHCLGDGFSLLKLTLNFLQTDMDESVPKIQDSAFGPSSGICEFLKPFQYAIRAPYDLISEISDSRDTNSWHISETELRRTLNGALSPQIPISKIKTLKNLHKVSFNSIIMECFASSLRKFMTEAGYKTVPASIHCAVPLPMPQHPSGKMRNHLKFSNYLLVGWTLVRTACYVSLPIGLQGTRKRLEAIESDLARIKNSQFPAKLFYALALLGGLPAPILRPAVKNNRTTALMSNFPGPPVALDFDGHKMTSLFFGGGLHNGRCGMGFSAVSCTGQMRFVFALDEGLVSRERLPASHLVNFFMEALDNLQVEAV